MNGAVRTLLLPALLAATALCNQADAGCIENPPSLGDVKRCQSEKEVLGWADTHLHPTTNQAFGGWFVSGEPFYYDAGGTNKSNPARALAPRWKPTFPPLNLESTAWLAGIVAEGMDEPHPWGLNFQGWNKFDRWPLPESAMFQKVYVDWLKRSYDYGQRLAVFHPVQNEFLCNILPRDIPFKDKLIPWSGFSDCNDMLTGIEQLKLIKEMVKHNKWMEIALTPADARRIIGRDDHLAVILGFEVDSMFNCGSDIDSINCNKEHIRRELDKLIDLGVRHFFPIHLFDNEFGGAAFYESLFFFANHMVRKTPFLVQDCKSTGSSFAKEINFRYDPATGWAGLLVPFLPGLTGRVENIAPPFIQMVPPLAAAHCNRKGLSWKGEFLVNEIMRKGLVLEVDHFSAKSLADAWALTRQQTFRKYQYPVIAGHTQIRDVKQIKHEADKDSETVEQILNQGGMVAVNALAGKTTQYKKDPQGIDYQVNLGCQETTESYAQMLLAALNVQKKLIKKKLANREEFYPGLVSLSTDMHTPGGKGLLPRERCSPVINGQIQGVSNPVIYNSTIWPNSTMKKRLSRYSMGSKTWDFNYDGLAHYGLIPDMIADLRKVGIKQEDLNPLLNSAEGYIRMWEKAFGPVNARIGYSTRSYPLMSQSQARQMTGWSGFNGGPARWFVLEFKADNVRGWDPRDVNSKLTLDAYPRQQCYTPKSQTALGGKITLYCAVNINHPHLNNYDLPLDFNISGNINRSPVTKAKTVRVTLPKPTINLKLTGVDVVEQQSCDFELNGSAGEPPDPIDWNDDWFYEAVSYETPHPYADNSRSVRDITKPGAREIKVHFFKIQTERHWDYVRMLDKTGRELSARTGQWHGQWSPIADGDTIRIAMDSDVSVRDWGWHIDRIAYTLGEPTSGSIMKSPATQAPLWRHKRGVAATAEGFVDPGSVRWFWEVQTSAGPWVPLPAAGGSGTTGSGEVPVCPCADRSIRVTVYDDIETASQTYSVPAIDLDLGLKKRLSSSTDIPSGSYDLKELLRQQQSKTAEIVNLQAEVRYKTGSKDARDWEPIDPSMSSYHWDLSWSPPARGGFVTSRHGATPIPFANIRPAGADNRTLNILMGDAKPPETGGEVVAGSLLPGIAGAGSDNIIDLSGPLIEGITIDPQIVGEFDGLTDGTVVLPQYSEPVARSIFVGLQVSYLSPNHNQAACAKLTRCITNVFDATADSGQVKELGVCNDLPKEVVEFSLRNPDP